MGPWTCVMVLMLYGRWREYSLSMSERSERPSVGRLRLCGVGRLWMVVLFGWFLGLHGVLAQHVEVSAPDVVRAGERFQVSYTVDAKPEDLQVGEWGTLQVLMGPSVGYSASTQIINGKMSQSYSYTYTYVCRATQPGDVQIPGAVAVVGGQEYRSEPLRLTVLAANSPVPPRGGASGRSAGQQPGQSEAQGTENPDDLLVDVELSHREVYQGQPIVATLKLYARIGLVGFEDLQFPDFKGFWAKELPTSSQVRFVPDVHNGKRYNVGVLRQFLLYPQQTGKVEIPPLRASIECRVEGSPRSFFDEFMGTFRTEVRTVASKAKTVTVKPLPSGAPHSFSGAVGQFTLRAAIGDTVLTTNQAVNYTVTISGVGNFHLLGNPAIAFPSTLEVYDPVPKANYAIKGSNQQGQITYDYVIIPRAPGKIEVPAYEFSYFDLEQGCYKTVRTPSYHLRVIPDSTGVGGGTVARGVNKEDVQFLGSDIRHINSTVPVLLSSSGSFLASSFFWIWVLLAMVLFFVSYLYLRQRQILSRDVTLARDRRALRMVNRRLRRAKQLLETHDEQFFQQLLQALWGYLGDKLNLETADMSSTSITEQLHSRGVPDDLVARLHDVIADCEFAQYAPSAYQGKPELLYDKTSAAIVQLDSWLNKFKSGGKA